jgi:hypothetical protein
MTAPETFTEPREFGDLHGLVRHPTSVAEAIGGSIFRHGERRLCRGGAPRLDPGHAASLESSDGLAGDFIIKGRPTLAGARPSSV